MMLSAWFFTWLWPVVLWFGYIAMPPSGERTVAFGFFSIATWGASTWSLWRLGVLRRIYGSSDISTRLAALLKETLAQMTTGGQPMVEYTPCPVCNVLVAPGMDHSKCR